LCGSGFFSGELLLDSYFLGEFSISSAIPFAFLSVMPEKGWLATAFQAHWRMSSSNPALYSVTSKTGVYQLR